MTTLDRQQHMQALVPDYALGLLGEEDARRLEQHATGCPACREAMQRERDLAATVRTAVGQATRPNAARLSALRPLSPSAKAASYPVRWQQLAPVTMILFLILSVMFVQFSSNLHLNDSLRGLLPTTNTPTATATSVPTATIAAQPEVEHPARVFSPTSNGIEPVPTPPIALLPTPVAALSDVAPVTN